MKGVEIMEYVYFVEVGDAKHSNKAVFELIKELSTPEEQVFSDIHMSSHPELQAVMSRLKNNDILIVRSVMDVADSLEGVLENLSQLKSRGAELYSCEEPYLNGKNAYDILVGVRDIISKFAEQKRAKNYNKALAEKRVGRPKKTKAIEKAVHLYETTELSVAQIELLTKVSRTTLYKALKNN